jgi:hypothetical protein
MNNLTANQRTNFMAQRYISTSEVATPKFNQALACYNNVQSGVRQLGDRP